MNNRFIFDVDGTLTPSRGRMNKHFASWFSKFCEDNDVYLVTGSDRAKTVEQVGEFIYHACKRVYNCSGSDVYEGDINVRRNNWTLPTDAHEWLTTQLTECDFNIRTGLHFEHRTGMVNFSIVGRNANADERAYYVKWDKETSERANIAVTFNTIFPDLDARVGGETGIDISPRGYDKSQIKKDFWVDDTLWFFGDAIYEGGNDYPLAQVVNNHRQVRDWRMTKEYLQVLQEQRIAL